jgi:uncharacterized protein
MALTPSANAPALLSAADRRIVLAVARAVIAAGMEGRRLSVDPAEYAAALLAQRASFVTLTIGDDLRGCIGTLEPKRPLIADVAENAHGAAFRDPRFVALTRDEFAAVDIHVSVLSAPEPLRFSSEEDLLRQLRPGIDGLILDERGHHGTFLPDVWRTLPAPRDFVSTLKLKAGLPPDYWSDAVRVSRYTTESIP